MHGRSIPKNILIAQILHSFQTKNRKNQFIAIKLDIQKVFDRLD